MPREFLGVETRRAGVAIVLAVDGESAANARKKQQAAHDAVVKAQQEELVVLQSWL